MLGVLTVALMPSLGWASGDFTEYPLQTLSDYLKLDQLPAKSTSQILEETAKAGPKKEEKVDFLAELQALSKKPGPEALAALDRMLVASRTQASNAVVSLLLDLRDLYAGPANAAETTAYIEWRIEQADQFGASFQPAPAEEQERKPVNKELVADIERHLAKASPALKPHWIYLHGALEYRAHEIAKSQPYFEKVANEFPKSPRAEAALYMAARCQLWKSRSETYLLDDMQLVAAERPKTKKLWDEYFARYPHGRLLGDALGWYGAYCYDGHDFGTALSCYAQQLEMADHPELADGAAQMIERTLSHLASEPKDKAFFEVAKHPLAAQALVYLVLNTAEADNYNGKLESIDTVRGWRKSVLPRLAAAISADSKLYQSAEWKPRYLAMLAYAASNNGQHDPALKLLQSAGPAAEESDDLLMARGVVQHRAKQPGEAAKTLQILLAKFPKSPLARGARLRLALALTDDHRAGEAVLALNKLRPVPKDLTPKQDASDAAAKPDADKAAPEPEPEPEEPELGDASPILYGIDLDQVEALIDTLLNFAPVEELAATAQTPNLDPVLRLQLTEPIAERLLAREQFDEAKKYLTPAQYGLVAEGLEKLTIAARAAKDPAARAAACLKLGDAWAAARGKLLTYPLDTHERRNGVYRDYSTHTNERRVESAPFIGATGNYKLDLENRDELRHAFNWWLEASDAQPGTPQNAPVLWRTLKAMPQIADVSTFTFERAVARKWGDVARKLYDRLRTECPDSVEAKRYAVAWDFAAPKKPAGGNDGEAVSAERDPAGTGISGATALGVEGPTVEYQDLAAFTADVAALESEISGADIAKARAKVAALRKKMPGAGASFYDARWVNLLDDLALFLTEPDPGVEIRRRYAEMRFRFTNRSAVGRGFYGDDAANPGPDEVLLADVQKAVADPATKAVADYFAFLKLAVIANHYTFVKIEDKDKNQENLSKEEDTYSSRDYPLLAKEAQTFLEKYPQSKKREAALLLHARAVYRSSEQISLKKIVNWPRASRWEGGDEPTLTQQERFDPKTVLAALDAYDHAFPHGRYASDIREYRAAVAFRQHDWKTAIDLSLAQLDGHDNIALNTKAADRLGNVFAQIADERYRLDVFAAIKENKHARELFEKYLALEDDAHPLLYMKTWVRQQLAAK